MRYELCGLALLLLLSGAAPNHADPTPTRALLLLGQSNMSGRGVISADPDQVSHPRVVQLTRANLWELAIDPLEHHDYPGGPLVGPGLTLGKTVADANPTAVVGLVPCAHSGTAISLWAKGTELYNDVIARAAVATNSGAQLVGIFWQQGEADSRTQSMALAYSGKLATLIDDLRTDLDVPDLPFVCGQLGEWLLPTKYIYADIVNAALADLSNTVPHTACVPSTNLNHIGDEIHFDAPAARELGRRYAAAIADLTQSNQPPAKPLGFTATAVSPTRIDLAWTDAADNEDYYKAYRSPDGSTGWARIDPDGGLPPNTESFSDTNCTPDTTYFYHVRCINAHGNSDYSNTDSATTPAGTPTNLATFVAYNDLAWFTGQMNTRITTYTTTNNNPGAIDHGFLVDYDTGAPLTVTLTVTGGGTPQVGQGAHPNSGTDAHTVFDGKVNCASTISYSATDLTLTFSGLSTGSAYEVAIYPDRDGGYSNRNHHATIEGASFVNDSSTGTTVTTVYTIDDTTIFNAGDNNADGYVSRFTAINPGLGTFTITLRQDIGATYFSYANAVMLKTVTVTPPALTEKIAKGASWRYAKGTAEPSAPPTAWRSVAFDDSGWALGPTPLGYKNPTGGLATSLGDMYNGYSTVYMRNTFTVPNPAVVNQMTVQMDYDDGFILFLNGQEIARVNVAGVPGTFMAHTNLAVNSISLSSWSDTWDKASLPILMPGQNIVALQAFNCLLTSSDLHMNLALAMTEGSYLDPADDTDADGMDDAWETANCAGGNGIATNDIDNDGVTDAGEFVAGTLPTDPASVFALDQARSGDDLLISFDALEAAGTGYDGLSRHYAIEECLDLDGGAWSPVPGYADITIDTDTTITYTNPAGQSTKHYRGRVWLQ